MKVKLLSIICLFIFLNINKSIAQTTLNPGDIAFVMLNLDDNPMTWSWVPLVEISSTTVIYFTDDGWNGYTGTFVYNQVTLATNNDDLLTFTATSTIPKGTVITFNGTTFSPSYGTLSWLGAASPSSTSGDQMLAYQGAFSSPTFIAGVHSDYNSSIYDATTKWANNSENASYIGLSYSSLPSGLTNGTNAVSLFPGITESDNAKYTGSTTSGTKTELLAAINNYSNWSNDNTTPYTWSGNFTVNTSTVAPTVTTQAASSINTTTATGNGSITATGGANATNRGVIWYAYSNTDKIIGEGGVTNVSETGTYGVAAFTASLTGLAVNTHYNVRAHATNSAGTSYGSRVDFWTLANVPAAPTVNNATSTSLDVAINVNSNPTGTEFAIQETSGNLYVQANGTLGASAVWQTNSNWGTKTVTGLTSATSYTFKVKARNGATTETAFSSTTSLSTKTPGLWTGATSIDWHTTTNWDDGVVPTATVDVSIPNVTNKPVIGNAAVCRNLTVQSSSSLTIQTSNTLNIKGNMTLGNSSIFSNSGTLKFSGTNCYLQDNRSSKTTLGNVIVED